MHNINFEEVGPFLISEDGTITVAGRESASPAIVLNGAFLPIALPFFDEFNCRQLTLICHEAGQTIDLSPISDIKNLLRLSISCQGDSSFSVGKGNGKGSSDRSLSGLIDLEIKGAVPDGFPDVSKLRKLRKLAIEFDVNRQEWLNSTSVIDLKVTNFDESDLKAFNKLSSVRRLCLVGGALQSVKGIADMAALETLHCVATKKLTDLAEVNLAEKLVNLKFEAFSTNKDWKFLGRVSKWKELSFESAESIGFLDALKKLEFFYCKKIIDGDKSPLDQHKNLEMTRTKREQLEQKGTPSSLSFYETLVSL
jgi:hypothetical protein